MESIFFIKFYSNLILSSSYRFTRRKEDIKLAELIEFTPKNIPLFQFNVYED